MSSHEKPKYDAYIRKHHRKQTHFNKNEEIKLRFSVVLLLSLLIYMLIRYI